MLLLPCIKGSTFDPLGRTRTSNPGLTADFAGNNYTGMISVTRTASAYAQDSSGNLTLFAPNTARVTNLGLLVEEAQQNNALWSQDYTQATTWPVAGNAITRTAAAITAPDGTTTGQLIADNQTTSANYGVKQTITTNTAHKYVGYFIVKKKDYQWFQVNAIGSSSGQHQAFFDLTNGVVGSTSTGTRTAGIIPLVNGWYVCWVGFTAGTDSTVALFGTYSASSSSSLHTGVVGTGTYFWGAQFCDVSGGSSLALSYIPTTTAAVLRDADVVTASGTLLTALSSSNAKATFNIASSAAGVAATLFDSNGVTTFGKTTANDLSVIFGSKSPTNTTTSTWTGANTASLAWSPKGNVVTLNGVSQSSPYTGTPAAPITIGKSLNGYISKITVAATSGIASAALSFRDFTPLVRHPDNPTLPANIALWNAGGSDTAYFRIHPNYARAGGGYFCLNSSRVAGANQNLGWTSIQAWTTTDIIHWTLVADVITAGNQGGLDVDNLFANSVIKIGAVWHVYYSASTIGGGSGTEQILHASTTDPLNPAAYTYLGAVTPTGYATPNILPDQEGGLWVMYCAIRPSGNDFAYFTSPDGTTWTLGGTIMPMLAGDFDFACTRNENPFVFKNSAGFYELSYSEDIHSGPNFFQNICYGVCATPFGPFYKQNRAIWAYNPTPGTWESGPPGNSVFNTQGGTFYFGYLGETGTPAAPGSSFAGGFATMPDVLP